ncbi:multiple sugar transport system substrate-binding protein [Nonomuraea thailandensis]|uniref:Multiple sugar transport system substrate-binding protein n=1 Tax=Nonomuraea thailandensis TaxID=1188745 RepID=A0A9X2K1U7_9ACTN|nr:extracellular solute-binding protein [Nonomuraea thailandensis]MCP2357338.1 multiple sugar transport system substrate-binding protein [Nonomuraea thailandensis]
MPRSNGLAALCLTGVLLAVTACGGSPAGGGDGTVELRFGWWGNNDRAAATQRVIDAFQKQNPGIKVKGSYTDFNSYFDRLATEVAGGRAPDVITLGGAYPREYGDRGALLDLAETGLKTDKIGAAALDNGKFGGVQYGVPTGVNAIAVVVNEAVFEQAGVPLPDEDTWTWDDFTRTATELAGKLPEGTFALADPTRTDMLDAYSRQRGEALYTADGKVGISEGTLVDWWTMTLALMKAGATPPASQTAELITQPAPEQSLMGRGQAAMQFDWSNQLTALGKAAGRPLRLMRVPGESARPGMWLQASQIYSVNARSEHPQEAAKLVDFLVNSPEAGKIILADRGIPANSDVRAAIQDVLGEAEKTQAAFIDALTPKAGPPLVIGPAGSTDTPKILDRVNAEVLFGRQQPAAAAADFVRQVSTAIKQ